MMDCYPKVCAQIHMPVSAGLNKPLALLLIHKDRYNAKKPPHQAATHARQLIERRGDERKMAPNRKSCSHFLPHDRKCRKLCHSSRRRTDPSAPCALQDIPSMMVLSPLVQSLPRAARVCQPQSSTTPDSTSSKRTTQKPHHDSS